jgi:hypothetical protein
LFYDFYTYNNQLKRKGKMSKTYPLIAKKIMMVMILILFLVSMSLFISPGNIYAAELVTSIIVTGEGSAITVANGGTLQMNAAVFPVDAAQDVDWSVAPDVLGSATINNSGVLTGTGMGTVHVIASAKDGSDVSGYLIITVTAPVLITSITLTGAADAVTVLNGGTLQMSATFLPADATNQNLTWTVASGTGSATIDAISGLLTGTGAGTVTVTATSKDGSTVFGTCQITVTAQAPPGTAPIVSAAAVIGTGWSALSNSFSVSVYEKTITGFVTLFYNRILNRAPDIEGLNGWVAGLTSGALTGADLVRGFIFSEENKAITAGDTNEQFLITLYRLIFNRVPDAGGLKSWLDNISAGMTKEKVINYFTSSAEFKSLCDEYGVKP